MSRLRTIARRFGSPAITTFIVIAGVLIMTFLAVALIESRAAGKTAGTVIYAVLMGSLVLLFVKLNDLRERRAGRAKVRKPMPSKTPRTHSLAWTILIFAVGALLYFQSHRNPQAEPRGEARSPTIVLVLVLVLGSVAIIVAIYAGPFLLAYLHNRAVDRFFKRSNEGDPEGAIAALREEIASKGATALRVNSLGVLLVSQQRWEEGDEQFREAVRLSGRKTPQLDNHALATWKLGRAEDSAAIFAEIEALGPLQLVSASNYCRVLVDLGRIEEACEQLAHAEELAVQMRGIAAEDRSLLQRELQECRDAVAGLGGGKKDLSGLDEL